MGVRPAGELSPAQGHILIPTQSTARSNHWERAVEALAYGTEDTIPQSLSSLSFSAGYKSFFPYVLSTFSPSWAVVLVVCDFLPSLSYLRSLWSLRVLSFWTLQLLSAFCMFLRIWGPSPGCQTRLITLNTPWLQKEQNSTLVPKAREVSARISESYGLTKAVGLCFQVLLHKC